MCGNYINTLDVWKALGSDAYTKVRDESISYSVTSSVVNSVKITGSSTPDINGIYNLNGTYNSQNAYQRVDASYWIYNSISTGMWLISITKAESPSSLWYNASAITGSYTPYGMYTGSATGSYNSYLYSITGGFAKDNVVSGSETISSITGSATMNYDDGEFTANLTDSSSTITADYNYADIPDSQMQILVNQSETELENLTGRKFYVQTSSTEYHDVDEEQKVFWTNNYPVINLTASHNVNSVVDAPSWSSSTEGLGNDYLMDDNDKLIGKLEFIDNYPYAGQKKLKLNYSYGYSTIPNDVKELATLLCMRKMINSAIYRAIFKGRDNFSPARLNEIEDRIKQLTGMLRKQNINLI